MVRYRGFRKKHTTRAAKYMSVSQILFARHPLPRDSFKSGEGHKPLTTTPPALVLPGGLCQSFLHRSCTSFETEPPPPLLAVAATPIAIAGAAPGASDANAVPAAGDSDAASAQ